MRNSGRSTWRERLTRRRREPGSRISCGISMPVFSKLMRCRADHFSQVQASSFPPLFLVIHPLPLLTCGGGGGAHAFIRARHPFYGGISTWERRFIVGAQCSPPPASSLQIHLLIKKCRPRNDAFPGVKPPFWVIVFFFGTVLQKCKMLFEIFSGWFL